MLERFIGWVETTPLDEYIYIHVFVEDPKGFGLQSLLLRKLQRSFFEDLGRTTRMTVKMRRCRKCFTGEHIVWSKRVIFIIRSMLHDISS